MKIHISPDEKYTFEFKDIDDVLIYSDSDMEIRNSIEINKISEGAIDQLNQSYEEHKKEVKGTYNYEVLLNKVNGNKGELKNVKSEERIAVASKLSNLAKERIQTKEKSFSSLTKNLYRFGHLLQGHGFRTKGEWGLKLASNIKEPERKNMRKFFENLKDQSKIEDWQKKYINDLSDQEFKEILDNYILKKELEGLTESFDKSIRLIFIDMLNSEKKDLFYDHLVSKKDWYILSLYIFGDEFSTEGDAEEFRKLKEDYIDDKMVAKFQENVAEIKKNYEEINNELDCEKFTKALVEKAIKDDYNNNKSFNIRTILKEFGKFFTEDEFNNEVLEPKEGDKSPIIETSSWMFKAE